MDPLAEQAFREACARTSERDQLFARALDANVMIQDLQLQGTLVNHLKVEPHLWRTLLVSWDYFPRDDGDLSLQAMFTLKREPPFPQNDKHVDGDHDVRETDISSAYAVRVPNLVRLASGEALQRTLELAMLSVNASWVADVLNQQRRVYLSQFAGAHTAELATPVLTSFAFEPIRQCFSAMIVAHPQLDVGESLIKYFARHCKFYTNTVFLAAVCSNPTHVAVDFFQLREPTDAQLLEPNLVEALTLQDFAKKILDSLHELYGAEP